MLTLLLSLLIGILLYLPGLTLAGAIWGSGKCSFRLPPAILPWICAIVFHAAMFGILEGILYFGLGIPTSHVVWTTSWFIGVVATFGAAWARGWRPNLKLLREYRAPIVAQLVVYCVALGIIAYKHHEPLDTYEWSQVSGLRTFEMFLPHDNNFQYVNGRALANRESFETYYGGRKLTYEVQNRQMLPGILFASMSHVLGGVSEKLYNRYFCYQLMALWLETMMVWPLWWLARHFFPTLSFGWLMTAAYGSSFAVINTYYAWFKMTAGATLLMGFCVLLAAPRRASHWAIAGLLFGIGANCHASMALGLPPLVLWVLYREWQVHRRLGDSPTWKCTAGYALRPLLMATVFVLAMFPWSLVKKTHFPDDDVLVRQQFMAGFQASSEKYPAYPGLLATTVEFFRVTPLEEQVEQRWRQFELSVAPGREFVVVLRSLVSGDWHAAAKRWNQINARYLFVLYAPAVLLALAAWCWARRKKSATAQMDRDVPILAGLGLLTHVILIGLSFDRGSPEMGPMTGFTHTHPYGTVMLTLMLLGGMTLQGGPGWASALKVFRVGALAICVAGLLIPLSYSQYGGIQLRKVDIVETPQSAGQMAVAVTPQTLAVLRWNSPRTGDIAGIAFHIGNYGNTSDGELIVEACSNEVCRYGRSPLYKSRDNGFFGTKFNKPLRVRSGEDMTVRIWTAYATQPVVLWTYSTVPGSPKIDSVSTIAPSALRDKALRLQLLFWKE